MERTPFLFGFCKVHRFDELRTLVKKPSSVKDFIALIFFLVFTNDCKREV